MYESPRPAPEWRSSQLRADPPLRCEQSQRSVMRTIHAERKGAVLVELNSVWGSKRGSGTSWSMLSTLVEEAG